MNKYFLSEEEVQQIITASRVCCAVKEIYEIPCCIVLNFKDESEDHIVCEVRLGEPRTIDFGHSYKNYETICLIKIYQQSSLLAVEYSASRIEEALRRMKDRIRIKKEIQASNLNLKFLLKHRKRLEKKILSLFNKKIVKK